MWKDTYIGGHLWREKLSDRGTREGEEFTLHILEFWAIWLYYLFKNENMYVNSQRKCCHQWVIYISWFINMQLTHFHDHSPHLCAIFWAWSWEDTSPVGHCSWTPEVWTPQNLKSCTWLFFSLWMRPAKWATCLWKWSTWRAGRSSQARMPPKQGSWRPGSRWTQGELSLKSQMQLGTWVSLILWEQAGSWGAFSLHLEISQFAKENELCWFGGDLYIKTLTFFLGMK